MKTMPIHNIAFLSLEKAGKSYESSITSSVADPNPDPDQLVSGMDPDPSIIKQK
jgi:hypothetical protein